MLTARRVYLGKTTEVARALPDAQIRMIGAWCFLDHYGPEDVRDSPGMQVWAHPHTGLRTVSWLLDGEVEHRDSLGSRARVRPGELHIMTAGRGIVHSELSQPDKPPSLHGVQLWVAQPAHTRDGSPAFEHHPELPRVDLDHAVATVLIGELTGTASPARRDTDHVGIDLELHAGRTTVPLRSDYEHALVMFVGACMLEGAVVQPGHLAYLGVGRDEITLSAETPSRGLLIGGVPFDDPVLMWWNYVARTRDEIITAHDDWTVGAARFGRVDSPLPPIHVDPPPWTRR